MLFITKRSGQRARVRTSPGCLVVSLLLSIGVSLLLNLPLRLF
jgi:hypothetical protein